MKDPGLRQALRLIVITDDVLAAEAGRSVDEVVEAALAGGAPAIQVRDKSATAIQLLRTASRLRELTRASGALLFVNDRVDIALAAEADGVHLGPDDLPVREVRSAVPPTFLIGYSTDQPQLARQAMEDGADYVGCGAVFPTTGKLDAGDIIGLDGLEAVVRSVSIPVVAIGGIATENVSDVKATGAAGVAVIGAVMGAKEPQEIARRLLAARLA